MHFKTLKDLKDLPGPRLKGNSFIYCADCKKALSSKRRERESIAAFGGLASSFVWLTGILKNKLNKRSKEV